MRTVFRNDEIPGLIHALRPFLSEGRLPDGTRRWWAASGPAVEVGYLPPKYRNSARAAVYVVYSYGTPIAWVTENEDPAAVDDPYLYHLPDVGYSPTTGQHQYAVMEAWATPLRRQGVYRHWPARGRQTVEIPGNAEVYGRIIRARSGGMDGVRPGETVGRTRPGEIRDTGHQGPPVRGWRGHRAHP